MKRRLAVVRAYWALLAALLIAAAPNLALAIDVRTVALRFQQAPGTSAPLDYFNSFAELSLNDSGHVAFVGLFGGGGQGIWSEGNGALTYIARQGDQAKDTPAGVTYASFAALALNDVGQIAFRSGLNSSNGTGIWSGGTGQLGLVVRTGQQAPGFPAGTTITSLTNSGNQISPVFNNLGQTAFIGTASGFGAPTSIWLGVPGNVNLVARTGAQAHGLSAGTNFSSIFPAVLNHAGQVAFNATYNGFAIPSGTGVWVGNASSSGPIANTGVAAPGTGGNYGGFTSYIGLNDTGDAAFHGSANSTGGLWVGHAGGVAALALEGMAAPGAPTGATFGVFTVPAFLSNNGSAAFIGSLVGSGIDSSNDRGLWQSKSGNLGLVAREGDPAPGTGSGVIFENLSAPAINNRGQLAFRAELTGTGVDATNRIGIWVTDGAGQPQLVLRTGDQLQVAPGDVRTISTLNFAGNSAPSDGRATGFNDLGQIAFSAAFTNGTSGLFVTEPVAVPEPQSLAISVVGLMAGLLAANRRS